MADFDLLLSDGLIVYPGRGSAPGSVGVRDGTIAAILAPGESAKARRTIKCEGRWIMPGVIDAHAHFGFGVPDQDFVTESRFAAMGGTTTVLSFWRTKDFLAKFPDELARSKTQSFVDYGYHFGITEHAHVGMLEESVKRFGISSYKLYLMYKGSFGLSKGFTEIDDGLLFAAMEQVARLPGTVLSVHCENTEVIPYLRDKVMRAGLEGLPAWDAQSPDFLEAENVHRACYFGRITGCPINIVHLSSKEALDEVRRHLVVPGRPAIHVETCPHYLHFTRDAACGELAKVNPPVRVQKDQDAMWQGILDGIVDTIGSDHVARKRETKMGGIWKATAGFPGTGMILPVLLHEGHKRRGIGPEVLAAVASRNVARLYHLHRKGDIVAGYDADFAIVDPTLTRKVDPAVLESHSDYSPYEGEALTGWPVATVLRGKVIMEDGKLSGEAGQGQYQERRPNA